MSFVVARATAQDSAPDAGILVPKGPLPHRNSEPLNTLFLTPSPVSATILGNSRTRLDVNLDIVNNLLFIENQRPRLYVTDFEEQRLSLGFAYGLGRGQEIGVRTVYISRNGGILDTLINTWHKIFGFDGGGRELRDDYRTLFQINNAAGRTIINDRSEREGFGDTVLEYGYALTTLPPERIGTRQVAATVRALVKLPTGSATHLLGSGSTDAGLGFALSGRPRRNLALHGNFSVTFLGRADNDNLDNRRTLTHTLIGVEYLFDGRTSFVAQTDDNPAPFRSGLTYADRPRRAFTFGFWRQIGRDGQVYLLNSENDFDFLARHAPDFALSLGTRWLLR